ncbi:MAG TPA: transcription antitermination factor NusB [Gammaproteobacteria bacterium]|nr:transcription antitermination factor NusB [Gammaproteobacteria bacterium]
MSRDRGGARSRQRARELLVKALYQWQLAGHSAAEILAQFTADEDFASCDDAYFEALLATVIDNAAALDEIIARQAARGLEQLDEVGHAILLLALAELKYRDDVPTKVVINEAVELAKRYGAAESYKFVNALLDRSARELRHGPAPAAAKA